MSASHSFKFSLTFKMRFIYTILASEKLLGLSATAPRECSRGDSQCIAVFGGNSYCKYWQSPSVCHGSSTPCECDGSLPIVPGVVSPAVVESGRPQEALLGSSTTVSEIDISQGRREQIMNGEGQQTDVFTTNFAGTTPTTNDTSTWTTTDIGESSTPPTTAIAATQRRRRVQVVQAASGFGQVGSTRSVILTTSTTTPSAPEIVQPGVIPVVGGGPQATVSWSAPALVPGGMSAHITRVRSIVERYLSERTDSFATFEEMVGLLPQVQDEIRSLDQQSFDTVFDALGGNRLLHHVMNVEQGPVGLLAIMTIAAATSEAIPSSLIPARIRRDFCMAKGADLSRLLLSGLASPPTFTRLGRSHGPTFAAGWVRVCTAIAGSPQVSRVLLSHAIRRHQQRVCSIASCEPLAINTPRAEILEHAFGLLGSSGPIDLGLFRHLLAGVSSASLGETGYGEGVIRDWFTTLSIQLFGAIEFGIYERSESLPYNTRISPMLKLTEPERFQAWYRMSGRFMALSIIQGIPIGINFPRYYYSAILDQRPTLEDISVDDPELHRSLLMILDMTDEQLEAIGVGLEGSGFEDTPLNSENRIEQITARMSRMLLAPSDVSEQMAALKAGFFEVLPRHLFEGFTPAQLRAFIVGNEAIDVADLRRNVRVVNTNGPSYNQDSPQVVWFMEMMDEMDEAEKRNVLRWITGSSQVPLGGFANLRPDPMLITPLLNSGDGHLPTAHTCFNWIEIPRYSSKEILIQKVKQAVAHMEMGTA